MLGHCVDMIEELKLRRWARLNRRRLTDWEDDDSLHPIVVDELHTIWAELEVAAVAPQAEQVRSPTRQYFDQQPTYTKLASADQNLCESV